MKKIILLLSVFLCSTPYSFADIGKTYIDISSPGVKALPIAVQNFTGNKEISDIVQDDLNFTGLFKCVDEAAQIEKPEQPFNAANWKGVGVEVVVKGKAVNGRELGLSISVYDAANGRELLSKEYSAYPSALRSIAHTVSNDIHKLLTGQQGIFRSRIAFVAERSGRKELHLMDWDGARMHATGVTAGILLTPRWAKSGKKLLYSAERNREWGIYILDMVSMREKSIVALSGTTVAGNFFPNEQDFVFSSSKEGKLKIYVGNTNSMQGRELISSPWIDVSPTVSPDGNNVLFVSNRAGGPQVYISDKNGNGIRRLTFEGNYNTSPVWSPKGDRIAFVRMIGGKNQIFTAKLDGNGLTQLTNIGSNEDPSFSPDGRYIVFTSDRNGPKGIYIMRFNGEGQKNITPKGFKAASPNWSPF
ncbi:MAG: Tol-Pal system beta propeller repeat protein TolB [Nitrospirae bacterium]|nr:MAG: Tol-Pal system beta propeller repeat protein TolB [Nitrospirota bacterium]